MAHAHNQSTPAIVRVGQPARDLEASLEAVSGNTLHLYIARQAGVRSLEEGTAITVGYPGQESYVWVDSQAVDIRPVDVGGRFPVGYRFVAPVPASVRTSTLRRYPRVRAAYPVRFVEVKRHDGSDGLAQPEGRRSYHFWRGALTENGSLARGTWLGGGGMAMVSARAHEVGDRLFVEVDSPGLLFDVEAEVVWTQDLGGPAGGQARRVGLSFVGVSPFLRDAIIGALPAAAATVSRC